MKFLAHAASFFWMLLLVSAAIGALHGGSAGEIWRHGRRFFLGLAGWLVGAAVVVQLLGLL